MKVTRVRLSDSLVAIYLDDHQGRRIVIAGPEEGSRGVLQVAGVLGVTRAEVRQAAAKLRELADELPWNEPIRLPASKQNPALDEATRLRIGEIARVIDPEGGKR